MGSGEQRLGSTMPEVAELLPAADRNIFRRDGTSWTVVHRGTTLRLRNTKGLQYLACLLRHPGQRIGVRDLAETAVGGGMQAGASDEAVRLAVTKRIRDAIRNIGQCDPALGYHLSVSIKTGGHCVYVPDPGRPTLWME